MTNPLLTRVEEEEPLSTKTVVTTASYLSILAILLLCFIERDSTSPVIGFLFWCVFGVLLVVAPPMLYHRLLSKCSPKIVRWQKVGTVMTIIFGSLGLLVEEEVLPIHIMYAVFFVGYAGTVWLCFNAIAAPFDCFKKSMHAIRERTDNMPSPRLISNMDKCMWIFVSACSIVYTIGHFIDDVLFLRTDLFAHTFVGDFFEFLLGVGGGATLLFLLCLMRHGHRDRPVASTGTRQASNGQQHTTSIGSIDSSEDIQVV